MTASRFELVISVRGLKRRDALLNFFKLKGTFMDEEAFHALVALTKKQTEEASVDGKHVRKRITQGEQEAADAERYAEMERQGIQPTRPDAPDTGTRPFGRNGLEYVVIDALLEQLERLDFVLFGCRLEQKADKYTHREAKDLRRKGIHVKPGEYKKSEAGGEVFLYKLRFFFFKKKFARIVQEELMELLKAYASEAIHQRAHGFYNDHDNDTVELIPGDIPPSLEAVTRILYDDKGMYAKTIHNSARGRGEPTERRPSLKASIGEQLGNAMPFGIAVVKKPERKNGDTPPPTAS